MTGEVRHLDRISMRSGLAEKMTLLGKSAALWVSRVGVIAIRRLTIIVQSFIGHFCSFGELTSGRTHGLGLAAS
jgi:hypothetical protein